MNITSIEKYRELLINRMNEKKEKLGELSNKIAEAEKRKKAANTKIAAALESDNIAEFQKGKDEMRDEEIKIEMYNAQTEKIKAEKMSVAEFDKIVKEIHDEIQTEENKIGKEVADLYLKAYEITAEIGKAKEESDLLCEEIRKELVRVDLYHTKYTFNNHDIEFWGQKGVLDLAAYSKYAGKKSPIDHPHRLFN